ncbi:MAG TPA: NADH-quinone oxidoreductase subunit N [Acidimicrobiales bacterium]|nr:NADH-quinone oxidoreductase subunit N [Acidimicrobiales bacterium]
MIEVLASAFALPVINYTAILPELILLGGMLVMLGLVAVIPKDFATTTYAGLTMGIGTASLVSSLVLWHDVTRSGPFQAIAQIVNVDGFSIFLMVLVSSILIVAPMLAAGYLENEGIRGAEYYILALISGSGAMLMGASNDLIMIFLALEVLSIPLYVIAGLNFKRATSGEAAMKYFLLGSFSSAIFVYGIALTYGATGTTNLGSIAGFLSRNVISSPGTLYAGVALMAVGFAFKIAAVPFHMWSPDVYEGAPDGVVGFMAAIAKVGGFAALLRVFLGALPTLASVWLPVIWILAVLSLVVGAVVALSQRNLKRMLAYSSINHAGFILLGLVALSTRGIASSLYYLFAYSFVVLGSFAVIAVIARENGGGSEIDAVRNLGRRSPLLGTIFAIFLLAQAGAPFTTGFLAKFYVVSAAIDAHSYAIAIIAMLSAAVAAVFYLRVVLVMFSGSDSPEVIGTSEEQPIAVSRWVWSGLSICVIATVVFGVWPSPLIDFARAASLIFH